MTIISNDSCCCPQEYATAPIYIGFCRGLHCEWKTLSKVSVFKLCRTEFLLECTWTACCLRLSYIHELCAIVGIQLPTLTLPAYMTLHLLAHYSRATVSCEDDSGWRGQWTSSYGCGTDAESWVSKLQ